MKTFWHGPIFRESTCFGFFCGWVTKPQILQMSLLKTRTFLFLPPQMYNYHGRRYIDRMYESDISLIRSCLALLPAEWVADWLMAVFGCKQGYSDSQACTVSGVLNRFGGHSPPKILFLNISNIRLLAPPPCWLYIFVPTGTITYARKIII
jgi:hypothetical protein